MPKPRPIHIVCDTCGLDWKQHKPNSKGTVPLTECVRLLKDEVRMLRNRSQSPIFMGSGTTGSYVTARGIPLN